MSKETLIEVIPWIRFNSHGLKKKLTEMSKTMTKSELICKLKEDFNLTLVDASTVADFIIKQNK